MLTPIDVPASQTTSTGTVTPDKTVGVYNHNGNFQLMYEVPTGRKWIGRIGNMYSNTYNTMFVVPKDSTATSSFYSTSNNGATATIAVRPNGFDGATSSSYSRPMVDGTFTLLAGDKVYSTNTSSAHASQLLGIESNA